MPLPAYRMTRFVNALKTTIRPDLHLCIKRWNESAPHFRKNSSGMPIPCTGAGPSGQLSARSLNLPHLRTTALLFGSFYNKLLREGIMLDSWEGILPWIQCASLMLTIVYGYLLWASPKRGTAGTLLRWLSALIALCAAASPDRTCSGALRSCTAADSFCLRIQIDRITFPQ